MVLGNKAQALLAYVACSAASMAFFFTWIARRRCMVDDMRRPTKFDFGLDQMSSMTEHLQCYFSFGFGSHLIVIPMAMIGVIIFLVKTDSVPVRIIMMFAIYLICMLGFFELATVNDQFTQALRPGR